MRRTSPTQIYSIVSRNQQGTEHTRLRSYRLVLARMVWMVLVVLIVAFYFANLPVYFAQLQTVCVHGVCAQWQLTTANARTLHNAGFSIGLYAAFSLVLTLFLTLVWFAVGAFIAWRKSDDWLALLTSLFLVVQGVLELLGFLSNGDISIPLAYSSPAWYMPTVYLLLLFLSLIILVFSLFPDGRFVPGWMRWLVPGEVVLNVIYFFLYTSSSHPKTVLIPLLATALWLFTVVSIIGGQQYRYRRVSSPTERQQIKWIIFGLIVELGVGLVYIFPPLLFPELRTPGSLYFLLVKPLALLLGLFGPLCFGIAILRYRLWDIDRVINRTLVYSSLTTILVLVYAGLILALQALLRSIFHQTSDVAIVASTLAIAALFQPLRQRVQRIVERRFYRSKYDAAKIVAAYSATLRQEVDLDQLREHLLAVVQETMQPMHVSLWLRTPTKQREARDHLPHQSPPS